VRVVAYRAFHESLGEEKRKTSAEGTSLSVFNTARLVSGGGGKRRLACSKDAELLIGQRRYLSNES